MNFAEMPEMKVCQLTTQAEKLCHLNKKIKKCKIINLFASVAINYEFIMFELNLSEFTGFTSILSISIGSNVNVVLLFSDFFCSIFFLLSNHMEAEINQILSSEYWQKFTTSFINERLLTFT